MSETKSDTVPGIHCGHCAAAIEDELVGVEAVDVDLDSKVLTIHGEGLSDEALREAIDEAGYEAA